MQFFFFSFQDPIPAEYTSARPTSTCQRNALRYGIKTIFPLVLAFLNAEKHIASHSDLAYHTKVFNAPNRCLFSTGSPIWDMYGWSTDTQQQTPNNKKKQPFVHEKCSRLSKVSNGMEWIRVQTHYVIDKRGPKSHCKTKYRPDLGPGKKTKRDQKRNISIYSAIYCKCIYGDIVARGRTIDGTRKETMYIFECVCVFFRSLSSSYVWLDNGNNAQLLL